MSEGGAGVPPVNSAAPSAGLEHPFDSADYAPGAAKEAGFRALTLGEEEVIRIQREKLALWRAWKAELSTAEQELHRQMPHRVASVYRGKSFLLLKRILRAAEFGYW